MTPLTDIMISFPSVPSPYGCQNTDYTQYNDSGGRITGIERVNIEFSDPLSVESLSFNSDSEDSSWALEYYGTIDRFQF